MTLNSAQKKYLKGLAHKLNPVVQIGKQGITDQLINEIEQQMGIHELIKIRFGEFKDEKEEYIEKIEKRTQATCIGKIGHIAMFYKESPDKKNKITFPKNTLKK